MFHFIKACILDDARIPAEIQGIPLLSKATVTA